MKTRDLTEFRRLIEIHDANKLAFWDQCSEEFEKATNTYIKVNMSCVDVLLLDRFDKRAMNEEIREYLYEPGFRQEFKIYSEMMIDNLERVMNNIRLANQAIEKLCSLPQWNDTIEIGIGYKVLQYLQDEEIINLAPL
ncbi:hypothetical protein QAD02_018449 [Eretmocerus hayati]|uniref:Uncharacterized protein n=1 Tax=Eretmocerus hayati TaxID=131215 RepID=A0ACC2PH28_9HYME|nr:hypothetical protein QAD02_018449 [Eretmocerus hayati]